MSRRFLYRPLLLYGFFLMILLLLTSCTVTPHGSPDSSAPTFYRPSISDPSSLPSSSSSDAASPPPAISLTTDDAAKVADAAYALLGIPGQYGGDSPESGFDTSGLSYYVYSRFSIRLPRTVSGQAGSGTEVPYDALLPGDLLFFSVDLPGHAQECGIYTGNGEMIFVSRDSAPVASARIDDKYGSRFVTARRILAEPPPPPEESSVPPSTEEAAADTPTQD